MAKSPKGNYTRAYSFDSSSIDEAARTVEIAFSSEIPAQRYFGIEILDHGKDSVDLERLLDGAPLLDNHNSDKQIGVVEEARIEDGKGRAKVRFSKNKAADEVFQDVVDGIKTKISVGYALLDGGERDKKADQGDTPAYRFKNWEPYELSFVSIPLDNSVGVGRNADLGDLPSNNNTNKHNNMDKTNKGEPKDSPTNDNVRSVQVSEEDIEKKIEARHAGIEKLAKQWNLPEGAVENAKRSRVSVDDFARKIANKEIEIPSAPAVADELGLSKKEKRSYSLSKALRALAAGKRVDGLEGEVSEAIAERCGRDTSGFFMAGERDLTVGTATDGAELVDEELRSGDFVDVLRPNMLTGKLGVRMLTGLTGNVSIPRKTSASAAGWAGDEVTTAHSESEPQFASIDLSPQALGCFTDVSKQLLMQSTPSAEALIRDDLNQAVAVALDAAVFQGSGSGQPQGVDGASGVGTSTIAVAAAPTLAELTEFISDVDTANGLADSMAWVVHPTMRGYLMQTLKTSGVSGYMWDHEDSSILGYNANSTTQCAATDIFFGNWSDYILAVWDGIEITVDPYSGAKNRLVTLILNVFADGDVRQAGSFSTNA